MMRGGTTNEAVDLKLVDAQDCVFCCGSWMPIPSTAEDKTRTKCFSEWHCGNKKVVYLDKGKGYNDPRVQAHLKELLANTRPVEETSWGESLVGSSKASGRSNEEEDDDDDDDDDDDSMHGFDPCYR